MARTGLSGSDALLRGDLIVAPHPVAVGEEGQIVGAIATIWTDAPQRSVLKGQIVVNFAIGCLVALGFGAALWFTLGRMLDQPLRSLGGALARMAAGNYALAVAPGRRHDEIAVLAGHLEKLRQELARAEADRAEARADDAARRQVDRRAQR